MILIFAWQLTVCSMLCSASTSSIANEEINDYKNDGEEYFSCGKPINKDNKPLKSADIYPPWTVSIYDKYEYFGEGTIINSRLVLTDSGVKITKHSLTVDTTRWGDRSDRRKSKAIKVIGFHYPVGDVLTPNKIRTEKKERLPAPIVILQLEHPIPTMWNLFPICVHLAPSSIYQVLEMYRVNEHRSLQVATFDENDVVQGWLPITWVEKQHCVDKIKAGELSLRNDHFCARVDIPDILLSGRRHSSSRFYDNLKRGSGIALLNPDDNLYYLHGSVAFRGHNKFVWAWDIQIYRYGIAQIINKVEMKVRSNKGVEKARIRKDKKKDQKEILSKINREKTIKKNTTAVDESNAGNCSTIIDTKYRSILDPPYCRADFNSNQYDSGQSSLDLVEVPQSQLDYESFMRNLKINRSGRNSDVKKRKGKEVANKFGKIEFISNEDIEYLNL